MIEMPPDPLLFTATPNLPALTLLPDSRETAAEAPDVLTVKPVTPAFTTPLLVIETSPVPRLFTATPYLLALTLLPGSKETATDRPAALLAM